MRTVKKILLVTLSLCLVLGISACSQQTDSVPDETGNEGQEQTTPDTGNEGQEQTTPVDSPLSGVVCS